MPHMYATHEVWHDRLVTQHGMTRHGCKSHRAGTSDIQDIQEALLQALLGSAAQWNTQIPWGSLEALLYKLHRIYPGVHKTGARCEHISEQRRRWTHPQPAVWVLQRQRIAYLEALLMEASAARRVSQHRAHAAVGCVADQACKQYRQLERYTRLHHNSERQSMASFSRASEGKAGLGAGWTGTKRLHNKHNVECSHKLHTWSRDRTTPTHSAVGFPMKHDTARCPLARAVRSSQQAPAPGSAVNHCRLPASLQRGVAMAASYRAREYSTELPDDRSARHSWSTSEVSSGAGTRTEDRLLETAIDEWHQLCERLQHPS